VDILVSLYIQITRQIPNRSNPIHHDMEVSSVLDGVGDSSILRGGLKFPDNLVDLAKNMINGIIIDLR
jgi:hypothetical protein